MLTLPNDIEPLTPADAAEVEQNYSVIEQYLNTNVIVRQGTVAMVAPLQLAGPPSQDLHAATKAYVDAIMPVGVIMLFGGVAAPAGGDWALCNGAALAIASYPELHSVLGYRYGGSGGTFNLPNLNGRVPIGVDPTQTRFDVPGDTGGTWVVPIPQHQHSMAHDHGAFDSGVQSVNHTHSITHNHGNVNTTDNVIPQLLGEFTAHTAPASGSSWFARRAGDDVGSASFINESGGGAHHHSIDLPQYTGNSGNQSANHTHPVNVPNYVGNTAMAGTAGAEHLPPYLVVTYIIRVS